MPALEGHLALEAAWELDYEDVGRLRAASPEHKCLVVVDLQDISRALSVAGAVEGCRQIATIAAHGDGSREELVALMQAGFRDVVTHFRPAEIVETAVRAAGKLQVTASDQSGELYAFVPAKPGCGATTLGTYATAVAAQRSQEPTLLLDFDVRLGITSFLLRVEGTHTILDALEQAERLDSDLWSSLVCQRDMLHVLGSGPVEFTRSFPSKHFNDLLEFALRQYNLVSVDLPGTMEDYECAALLRAKRIFLVCAPDIGALHVARRKSNRLRDLRVADNVAVVLNRVERRNTFSIQGHRANRAASGPLCGALRLGRSGARGPQGSDPRRFLTNRPADRSPGQRYAGRPAAGKEAQSGAAICGILLDQPRQGGQRRIS